MLSTATLPEPQAMDRQAPRAPAAIAAHVWRLFSRTTGKSIVRDCIAKGYTDSRRMLATLTPDEAHDLKTQAIAIQYSEGLTGLEVVFVCPFREYGGDSDPEKVIAEFFAEESPLDWDGALVRVDFTGDRNWQPGDHIKAGGLSLRWQGEEVVNGRKLAVWKGEVE